MTTQVSSVGSSIGGGSGGDFLSHSFIRTSWLITSATPKSATTDTTMTVVTVHRRASILCSWRASLVPAKTSRDSRYSGPRWAVDMRVRGFRRALSPQRPE